MRHSKLLDYWLKIKVEFCNQSPLLRLFYEVTALLVKSGKINKSHSGVKTQFFMDFIKSGIMPLEYGKLYGDLFDWRQKGDYGDFFDFQEKDVVPLMIPTRKFIELIKNIVHIKEEE